MNVVRSRPVMIAAAGTGGHVFPALVVANELNNRNVPVIWLGTRKGIEAKIVPGAGFDIEWMEVDGLRGKGMFALLLAPWKLLKALYFSIRLLQKHKPVVVLGMGGFVTGPIGVAATLLKKPLVLHEQNAIPGMTNKLLGRFATRVLQAFPNAFPQTVLAITVGNPLRKLIVKNSTEASETHAGLHLLIVGGSLGARFFNETIPEVSSMLGADFSIRHQTGRNNGHEVRRRYDNANSIVDVQVVEFIEDMSASYQWADLVICRSGAMTVSELAASAMPSILVPFPHAVDDHQTKNAMFLVNAGAAILLQQRELTPSRLVEAIGDLSDKTLLKKMSNRAKELAVLDAGTRVADLVMEVAA